MKIEELTIDVNLSLIKPISKYSKGEENAKETVRSDVHPDFV